jgi:membrane protease YdiL (CAAX protease family)
MIILRSFCCGVAAVVVSLPVGIAVLAWNVARREDSVFVKASLGLNAVPGHELGPLMHEHPVATSVWLVVVFAIGFFLGWRFFSRRSSPQQV